MKLSDYITLFPFKDASGKITEWGACFAGEEASSMPAPIRPTKQMAAQALIENAMKLRHKEFTPTDEIRKE